MGKQKIAIVLVSIITFFNCKTKKDELVSPSVSKKAPVSNSIENSKAALILKKTIKAHGGDLYNTANYSFVFRGNTYSLKNDHKNYTYSKIANKENIIIEDFLVNGMFYRKVNNDTLNLSEKDIKKATGAINSVIYFATLPHKLDDEAVKVTYVEEIVIKGENYDVLNITFSQEGGGEDFEDQFHYWINKVTSKIDYLAYNYKVNNGGVRFRSAYNRRVIDGITFQDYINYKAELNTPLVQLPKLYEANELKEVSKIKTEHIINLNKNTQ